VNWRQPTVLATTPHVDDTAAWMQLARAVRDAADVGYRAVRLRADVVDARVLAVLEPVAHRGVHTQIVLTPCAIRAVVDAGTVLNDVVRTWLVEAPLRGTTSEAIAVVDDAIEALARRSLRRGLSVPLTKTRARDIEALTTVLTRGGCSHLVVTGGPYGELDAADELERSMAYVTARRISRESCGRESGGRESGGRAIEVEIDLFDREQVARTFAPALTTSVPLTRLIPTLVIGAEGQVDPIRVGIAGYSIGRLADAPLLQLLARWRATKAARWVSLHRAAIMRVGRNDAWPVIDWPAELAACARLASAEHALGRAPTARQ
jgi:hypothetical protein